MVFKRNISRYKQKLLIFLSALFIALTLQPKQTVYAGPEDGVNYSAWASSLVHSTGSTNEGGTAYIPNGVDRNRTGYLCYLLTADGAPVPGTSAVAFKSPGFDAERIPGAEWHCTSRKGGYTATDFNGGYAPWNCTPWGENGIPTHEPEIKAWFEGMTGNVENGVKFVLQYWGYDAAINYTNNEYIIVVETIMHFQYSSKGGSLSTTALAWSIIDSLYSGENGQKQLLEDAEAFNFNMIDFNSRDSNVQSAIIQSLKELLARHIKDALDVELGDSLEGSGRVFTSPPLIGTVPNLLEYKNSSATVTSNPFYSYTNRTAPFSERAIADGVAERAGFQVWTGSTSSEIPDADVMNYGLAMVIITANSDMQTTCDEPLQPAPHNPPIESTGHTTIVKSYRTKNMTTGELVDNGTFHQGDLGTQILIENETEYQVIDWKTSTTTNTGITSIAWNPPSIVQQQGKTPTSVTLQPTETCLYVLLERLEDEPPEELDYNYLLTESTITKRVCFSDPLHRLTNMDGVYRIEDHGFIWSSPAHNICPGHTYYGDCAGGHSASCDDVGCTVGCPDNCTKPHHDDTCLPGCTTQHPHETCKHQL